MKRYTILITVVLICTNLHAFKPVSFKRIAATDDKIALISVVKRADDGVVVTVKQRINGTFREGTFMIRRHGVLFALMSNKAARLKADSECFVRLGFKDLPLSPFAMSACGGLIYLS